MPDEVTWVPALGRYRLPSGRFVSRLTVRTTFEQSLANLTKLTDSLAGDLRAGRISLNAWLDEMRDIVKQTHMAAAELARGGRAQMTPSDYGRVGQAVRRQYEYLDRWVAEIKDGGSLQTEGRARQYLRASRSHYLSREAEEMERRGYLARNVLRPAEHCAACIAETDKGLVAPRFISPPGTRTCRGNCKCYLEFEKPGGVPTPPIKPPPLPPLVLASGTAGDQPPTGIGEDAANEAVRKLAAEFGVPVDDVVVVNKEGQSFQVGDRTFTEGGHYDPATNKIEINARYLSTPQQANGIVSHEMTHHAWKRANDARSAERVGVRALVEGPEEEYKRFFFGNGYLRPEMADEFGQRFPATRMFGKYGLDAYGATEAESKVVDKLRKADGVTDYSTAYWLDPNARTDTQYNETLAEISAIKHASYTKTRPVSRLWASFWRDMLRIANAS